MTDHTTRLREIEARLADGLSVLRESDLRYLLDRVRAQSERNEALEAAVREAARNHLSRVKSSEPLSAEDYRRLGIEAYDILQRVLIPAPETVEPAP